MNDTNYDITPGSHAGLRIVIRECTNELSKKAQENLLTKVYGRQITLDGLLVQLGATPLIIETLKYGGMSRITEALLECIKARVMSGNGGERRYDVLERYYGLDGYSPAKLSAMATKYGISRERVRQIKERAIYTLRSRYSISLIENCLVTQCANQTRLAAMSSFTMNMSPASRANSSSSARNYAELNPEEDGFQLRSHRELLLAADPQSASTAEQSEILRRMTEAKSLIIDGCAGSGKTWLAMATARRLAQEGKRTLLTCFNRRLADYLQSTCGSIDGLTVASFHALCLRLGRVAGINIPGGWNSRAWSERFPDVLMRAMMRDPNLRFDAIIIDDAHEMQANWWRALETSLANPELGLRFCFMDRLLATLPLLDSLAADIGLSTNLRTPRCIGESFFGSFNSDRKIRFRRTENVAVEFFVCETELAFRQTLEFLFAEMQESAGIVPVDTVVLSPRLPKYSSASRERLAGRARLVRRHSTIENHALLSRIEAFQGLEKNVTILIDLDEKANLLSDQELARMLYVGCSRFTDRLYLLGSAAALHRIVRMMPNAIHSPRALYRAQVVR